MHTLVLGGTRFFGKHLVNALLAQGHTVTIATRGLAGDNYGDRVSRIVLDRTDPQSVQSALNGKHFDVICDNLAYSSCCVKNLLDAVSCDRYVMTSSTAIYQKHSDTKEEEFDPFAGEFTWCRRGDVPYDFGKRQAEYAMFRHYPHVNAVAVRYPFVIGSDDYTRRLYFYVDHILRGVPMYVDNLDAQMAFVRSDEAGAFLAHLCSYSFVGQQGINGASAGTVSLREIGEYVYQKTGKSPVYDPDGDPAPYNGEVTYSINTQKAQATGFAFSPLREWVLDLIDAYIKM